MVRGLKRMLFKYQSPPKSDPKMTEPCARVRLNDGIAIGSSLADPRRSRAELRALALTSHKVP